MCFLKRFSFCLCRANELLMVEALISTPKSCSSVVCVCVCVCVCVWERYLCEVYCYSLIRGMEVWLVSCAQMGSSVWLQCFSLDFITSLLFLLSFTYTLSPPPHLSRTPLLVNHRRMTGGRCDWSREVIAWQVCWCVDCYRCVDVVLTSRLSET